MIVFIENHPCAAFHFILYEFRFEEITELSFTIRVSEHGLTIESFGSNEIWSVVEISVRRMIRLSLHWSFVLYRCIPNKFGHPGALATWVNFPIR